jgi:hypothetical protein
MITLAGESWPVIDWGNLALYHVNYVYFKISLLQHLHWSSVHTLKTKVKTTSSLDIVQEYGIIYNSILVTYLVKSHQVVIQWNIDMAMLSFTYHFHCIHV